MELSTMKVSWMIYTAKFVKYLAQVHPISSNTWEVGSTSKCCKRVEAIVRCNGVKCVAFRVWMKICSKCTFKAKSTRLNCRCWKSASKVWRLQISQNGVHYANYGAVMSLLSDCTLEVKSTWKKKDVHKDTMTFIREIDHAKWHLARLISLCKCCLRTWFSCLGQLLICKLLYTTLYTSHISGLSSLLDFCPLGPFIFSPLVLYEILI